MWGDGISDGQVIAEAYGLKSPEPIMCTEFGGCMHMFQSQNRYYLWNQIGDEVWEIQEQASLEDIVNRIEKEGFGSLRIRRIPGSHQS